MSRNLTSIDRLTPNIIYLLSEANVTTVDELIDNQDKLLDIKGIGQKTWSIIDCELGTNIFEKKGRKIEIEKSNKAKIKRLKIKYMTIKLTEEIKIGKPTWYAIHIDHEFVKGSFNKIEAYEYYKDIKEELIANPKTYGINILKEEKIDVNL